VSGDVYYSEHRPKIGAIELSIRPEVVQGETQSVRISKHGIKLNSKDIPLEEGTVLIPSKLGPVTSEDGILNMRLSAAPKLTLHNTAGKGKGEEDFSSFSCSRCSQTLLARPFKRLLPLPSTAWYEMADTLICHASHSKGNNNACQPRPGDCLVGEQEVWVHWNTLEHSTLLVGSSREMERKGNPQTTSSLKCERCRNTLGRVVYAKDKVEWAIVWKHSIHSNSLNTTARYHPEAYVARELLDASTRHLSYRFILLPRDPHSGFKGIRLWMMGGDISISSSLCSVLDEALSEVGVPSPSRGENFTVMKVLYTKHSEEVKDIWSDADVVSLPLDVCLQLWLVLQLSSLTLPPGKRTAQSCKVGYIRY